MANDAVVFLDEYRASRMGCYEFFSHFFSDKRQQALLDFFPMVEAFVRGENAFLSGGEELTEIATEVPKAGDELERDYARLFYGVGNRTIALSESVYRSEEGILCQGAWRTIKELYGKHGFQPAPEKEMEADSLSMEMGFASLLVQQNKDPADLLELVEGHLLPVGKVIARQIRENTSNETLLQVAAVMTVFLISEKSLLEKTINS